jgi:hypothetical protein
MLGIEWHHAVKILAVAPHGKLAVEDFTRLAEEVDAYLEKEGELNGLLIEAESFPGWHDFAALLSHVRFVKEHHQRIRKVAAVTDSGFLAILPKVAGHFLKAEVKHFPYHDRAAALAWLMEGPPV